MMNLTLWIATGLLAAIALAGGLSKTFIPREKLAAHEGGRWTAYASDGFVRTLGMLEILAAAGLILPAVTDIALVMIPVTGVCWMALMVGAMITHGRLGQSKLMMVNLIYFTIAAFVAWGRVGPESFA